MRLFASFLTLFCALYLVSCSSSDSSAHLYPTEPQPRPVTRARVNSNSAGLIQQKALPQPPTAAPKTSCKALCVIDPRTGRVLYSHNANQRRQVASTQKILTALCVIDSGNMGHMVRIKAEDQKVSRIRMDLPVGRSYRRYDLLRALLTGSFNDVAMTLARDNAGSVSAFMAKVNAKARKMGMNDSYFVNPNGLPAAQYSTAHDMAIAACYAYNNKIIRQCINTPKYQFQLGNGRTRTVTSTNKLLKDYPYVTGMKTGYTNAAGKCLISSATLGSYSVIVVALGSNNRVIWGESLKYIKWALQIRN